MQSVVTVQDLHAGQGMSDLPLPQERARRSGGHGSGPAGFAATAILKWQIFYRWCEMRVKSRTLSFFHLDGPAPADRASASWSRVQLRSADHDATCPGGRVAGSIGSPSRGLAHRYQLRVGHKADRRNRSAPQRKST